jgi:predicted nuclease of restriction endonuclease-like (RecB) superfamily
MPIEDPMERFFYELECIKGTWNVRELRRQIKLFRDFLDEAGFEILEVVGAVRDLIVS